MKIHHGGRIGDLIFALYTVKYCAKVCGRPVELIISNYHRPGWSLEIAKTMESLLLEQEYIKTVTYLDLGDGEQPTVEQLKKALPPDTLCLVQQVEAVSNPELFPEWNTESWPGNVNIAKRYFRTIFPKEEVPKVFDPWVKVNKAFYANSYTEFNSAVAFHFTPKRQVRSIANKLEIINQLKNYATQCFLFTSFSDHSLSEMEKYCRVEAKSAMIGFCDIPFLKIANVLSLCKAFYGEVSSINALAQAMGVKTFVDIAPGCNNTFHYCDTTNLKPNEVVAKIKETF